jgi:hypothetical protein
MFDRGQQFLTAREHSDNVCDRNYGIVKGVLRRAYRVCWIRWTGVKCCLKQPFYCNTCFYRRLVDYYSMLAKTDFGLSLEIQGRNTNLLK